MPEKLPIFLVCVWIVAICIIFCYKVQKALYVGLVTEITYVLTFGNSGVVSMPIAGPGAEKFLKVERFILKLNITLIGQELAQIVGVNLHFRELVIGVGISEIFYVPILLTALFHNIVPSIYGVAVVIL